MSLRLHQTLLTCYKDGENLWRVTRFIYDIGLGINQEIEEEPVCKKCDPGRYYTILQKAERIETLAIIDSQNIKQGKVDKMGEQEPQ